MHICMYFYYMMSAMGPQYQKYLWWKKYMTELQIVSFFCLLYWLLLLRYKTLNNSLSHFNSYLHLLSLLTKQSKCHSNAKWIDFKSGFHRIMDFCPNQRRQKCYMFDYTAHFAYLKIIPLQFLNIHQRSLLWFNKTMIYSLRLL